MNKSTFASKIFWAQVIGATIDIASLMLGAVDPKTAVYIGLGIKVLTAVLRQFSNTTVTLDAPLKLEDVKA